MAHFFVVHGDVTRIHCDAWLLPTDAGLWVTEGWTAPLQKRGLEIGGLRDAAPADWGDRGTRAFTIVEKSGNDPAVIAVNTGGHSAADPAWYLEGVSAALEVAARVDASRVCLPAVGMGAGGQGAVRHTVLEPLIPALRDASARGAADLVFVARDAPVFAAAQKVRRDDPQLYWPGQKDALLAQQLAAHARAGRLVLFLGAGIGVEVGFPSWDELLRELATGEISDQRAFDDLPAVDRAKILETRLSSEKMRERIAARFSGARYVSLAHALLASLPVNEVVTTNYDDLFEQAAESCGRPVAVLPYESVRDADRWILKLHGDANEGEGIVITRDDYLDFSTGRRALAGIVQSLLITRHMLFVGFSLRDDNFHQIAYDVRKAAPSTRESHDPFGTALFLQQAELLQNVWGHDLKIETMGGGEAGEKRLLILLDRVLAEATTVFGHLLDKTLDGLLSDDERSVRDALRNALQSAESDETLRSLLERSLAPFGAAVRPP